MIYLISGNGYGAGKTTFARKVAPYVLSLADGIREDLSDKYPQYDWWNRSQASKCKIFEDTGETLRDVMVRWGQDKCREDKTYWVDRWIRRNEIDYDMNFNIAVDDLRKLAELDRFRERFGDNVVHFHVVWEGAKPEGMYDAIQLAEMADYLVRRQF